nr:hypothetical protein [Tanacetum cinerariifolium]
MHTQTSSALHNDTVSSCSTFNVQEKTQEDHSNLIRALNVDSLKVDSVVIQNPCSKTEDSNSETASNKSVKDSNLDSATKDADTFTSTMLLNVDLLQKQLDKDEFQEDGSMTAFWGVNNQFQKFINSQVTLDYNSQMTNKYFVAYTGIEVKHFRDTLLQHMGIVKKSVFERARHQNKSSGTESEVQDDNSRSRNDTDAHDADIRPIYDEEPMAMVQLNAEWQHGQVLNAESNKAKIKKEIDVLETINIELEHKVANFRKENETLKKHYKDLYDSIKITRTKTIEQTTSLLANNSDLKAQIQGKVFAITALKNDLRKLKGNNEAKRKIQERDRNSKPSVMTPATFQSTTADSKPKPRSTIHSSRSLPMSKSSCIMIPAMPKADHSKSPSSFSDHTRFYCSTCNKCVFNANHNACITKLLKEVNSRAKIQSHKIRERNKPVAQKSHTQKPGR